ncbi:MAG: hypothetical protein ACK41T_11690 [Pseudobdellovibrio sp.]
MLNTLNKTEKLFYSALVVCLIAFGAYLKNISFFTVSQKDPYNDEINYKMGKVQDQFSDYSLEGREVDREFYTDPAKVKYEQEQAKKAENLKKEQEQKAKVAEQKKKEEKKQQQQKIAQKNNTNSTPKKNVSQTHSLETNKLTHQNIKQQSAYKASFYAPNSANQKATGSAATALEDTDKKSQKSYEELRNEFYSKPSQEAVITLVNSYKKGEVSKETYYKFITELLTQKEASYVSYGLYALRLSPSYESFSLLVKYEESANDSYKTYVNESLLAYNQSKNVNILQAAIQSSDKQVVLKALNVIATGVNQIKSGDVSQLTDGRNKREAASTTISIKNYTAFISLIDRLMTTATDTELANSLEDVKNLISESATQLASLN